MDTQNVLAMIRPFDPLSPDAEDQYDAVVRRLNRIRARRTRLRQASSALEHQFVDNDLTVRAGPRRGEPLSRSQRRRRLDHLIDIASELRWLDAEERFSTAALDRMNVALDRWARQTYGETDSNGPFGQEDLESPPA